jgi:hypothetical protein
VERRCEEQKQDQEKQALQVEGCRLKVAGQALRIER